MSARMAYSALLLLCLNAVSMAAPTPEEARSAKKIAYIRPMKAPTGVSPSSHVEALKKSKPIDMNTDKKGDDSKVTSIAYMRSEKAPMKNNGTTLTLGSQDDCTCRSQCTCDGADEFIHCLTNPSSIMCVPMDPTEACNSAAKQCSGDLDITCTPTSSGCQFECRVPPPVPAPGLGGDGCFDDKVKLFNTVCVYTPLGYAIYAFVAFGVIGLLYKGVKECCGAKSDD